MDREGANGAFQSQLPRQKDEAPPNCPTARSNGRLTGCGERLMAALASEGTYCGSQTRAPEVPVNACGDFKLCPGNGRIRLTS